MVFFFRDNAIAVMEEFWQQGDEDRKLGKPVDLMYDRELAHEMPVGQIGQHEPPFPHILSFFSVRQSGVFSSVLILCNHRFGKEKISLSLAHVTQLRTFSPSE